jgi:hypothetical protein
MHQIAAGTPISIADGADPGGGGAGAKRRSHEIAVETQARAMLLGTDQRPA